MSDHRHSGGFATRAVRAGQEPDAATHAHATPIVQTSTFVLGDLERGERLFSGEERGDVYSRIDNPTVRALEAKLASLEGAEGAVAFGSGMGAIAATFLSLLRAGDEVLFLGPLYGGTRGLLGELLPRFGVTARRVDDDTLDDAVGPATRMLYVESPTNPTLAIHDLDLVGLVARRHGLLAVADTTFATPALTRGLEHGLDLVIHSATKYLSGHGDVLAGVVAGRSELLEAIRMEGLRHVGATLTPLAAYLVLRGMRTLHLRMRAHCDNARAVAHALRGAPGVRHVHWPGFADHPRHDVAMRQMADFGGMVAVDLEGGRAAAATFLGALRLFDDAVSLGDVASLACHPASTTHQLLSPDVLRQDGVHEGLVRLSVGVEDGGDLVADVLQAAAAAVLVPARA